MKVLHNQSLLDLALQHTGSVENAFALAEENGISLTDDLVAGKSLLLPTYGIQQDKDILNYYQSKSIQPATGANRTGNQVSHPEGISYWTIGIDFKIS